MKDLSVTEEAFLNHFIIHGNAAASARHSGSPAASARERGYELLHRPHIASRLHQHQLEARARFQESEAALRQQLTNIGFAQITDVVSWTPDSLTIKSMEDVPDGALAAIESISESVTSNGGVRTIKVKLRDSLRALDQLARINGMYVERVVIDKTITVRDERLESYSTDDLEAWLEEKRIAKGKAGALEGESRDI